MSAPARILLVDSSVEARDILSTLLCRQGVQTIEADGNAKAAALLEQETPALIVCDANNASNLSEQETLNLDRPASRSATPIVVLGTVKRQLGPFTTGQFVSKPYHYRPLIRRIESLLEERSESEGVELGKN